MITRIKVMNVNIISLMLLMIGMLSSSNNAKCQAFQSSTTTTTTTSTKTHQQQQKQQHPAGVAFAQSLPELKPNTKRLYLLRHGQTDWNLKGLLQGGGYDIELNDNGKKQAQDVSNTLSNIPIDMVVSSHLSRAVETANSVHSHHPYASRHVSPDLNEMRFGNFEGMDVKGEQSPIENKFHYERIHRQVQSNKFKCWPGKDGENVHQVEQRAINAIENIIKHANQKEENDNDNEDSKHIAIVAIVSHSRTNKILLASLLFDDATKYNDIPQDNTCINVIDYHCDSNSNDNEENEDDGSTSSSSWNSILLNHVSSLSAAKHNNDGAINSMKVSI